MSSDNVLLTDEEVSRVRLELRPTGIGGVRAKFGGDQLLGIGFVAETQ